MGGGGPLGEARPADGLDHGALQHGLVQVMAAALARGAVDVEPGGRKGPVPRPLAAGVRVLAGKGPRQLDLVGAARQVGLVLALHPVQVLGEGAFDHGASLGALAVADDDLVHPEVEILDSQAAAFEEAQATPPRETARTP